MSDELAELRQWRRRQYLARHARDQRAIARQEGARRIDVTLKGQALDDFAEVRSWLEGELNGFINSINEKTRREHALRNILPLSRLSDREVIEKALDRAASEIREEREKARRARG
jgi:hypothetical protein